MKPEIKIEVGQGNTLTILEGKALDPKYPERINLSGNIHSVANFLAKRHNLGQGVGLQMVDAERAVVIVDESKMQIALSLDPENPFGTKVTGTLEMAPEIQQFGINTAKQYSREEFVKLLRFNRRFFASDHEKLLLAYQKLQIRTASEISQESDTRGNKGMNYQKFVNSDGIPEDFILRVPVFKGFPEFTFRVEICLDTTDASVRFWLESVELHELIQSKVKEILAEELKACEDFVIIHI
jgi:hypothetical protein